MTTTAPTAPVPAATEQTPTFTLARAAALDVLSTVALAIASRPAVPTMGGVLLEGDAEGVLTVSGFDYDTAVMVRIPDAVTAPGRLLLDHAELSKILKALGTGMRKPDADALPVRLRAVGRNAPTVEMAGTTVPLTSYLPQEYPTLPPIPPTVARLERRTFTTETGRVLTAVGNDETLPVLTGVKADFGPTGLTLVGTDRYRLAVTHLPATEPVPEWACDRGGVILPAAPLAKITKKLTAPGVDIGVHWEGGTPLVSLTCGPVTAVLRCLEGEFPAYRRLLAISAEATITLDRAQALAQVQRAAAVIKAKRDHTRPVALIAAPGEARLSPELSEDAAQVRTPALSAEVSGIGAPTCFHFSPGFLAQALESFTTPTVTLHAHTPAKPVVLTETPDGLADPTAFRHMLMPIRLPQ